MIALIYVAAILVSKDELEVSKFFFPSGYDAGVSSWVFSNSEYYYPTGLVRRRGLPVIDEKPEIKDKENVKNLEFKTGEIDFEMLILIIPGREKY